MAFRLNKCVLFRQTYEKNGFNYWEWVCSSCGRVARSLRQCSYASFNPPKDPSVAKCPYCNKEVVSTVHLDDLERK